MNTTLNNKELSCLIFLHNLDLRKRSLSGVSRELGYYSANVLVELIKTCPHKLNEENLGLLNLKFSMISDKILVEDKFFKLAGDRTVYIDQPMLDKLKPHELAATYRTTANVVLFEQLKAFYAELLRLQLLSISDSLFQVHNVFDPINIGTIHSFDLPNILVEHYNAYTLPLPALVQDQEFLDWFDNVFYGLTGVTKLQDSKKFFNSKEGTLSFNVIEALKLMKCSFV